MGIMNKQPCNNVEHVVHTCESHLCSVSERLRPRWREPRPSSSYTPRMWSSEGGRPSPWPARYGPGLAWSTLNSALMYSDTKRQEVTAYTASKLQRGKLRCLSNRCSCTYNVTALAVTLLVEGVERLPSEAGVAGDARETLHVEHLLHGDTAAAVTDHVVATSCTATCKWKCYIS